MSELLYTKNSNITLTKNFNTNEFDCHGKGCCNTTKIDSDLVDFLQRIRDYFDKPIIINSGYRCSTHNKKVGGSSRSQHLEGCACDIVVQGVKPAEVAKFAESIGVLGIGLYDTFVHIDTRKVKSFWYSDKELKRTTFGGVNKVLELQKTFKADGYGIALTGRWDADTKAVAKKAIVKRQYIFFTKKERVKFVQRMLGLKEDGKFGKATEAAVKKLQDRCGLGVDGIVGIDTYTVLTK